MLKSTSGVQVKAAVKNRTANPYRAVRQLERQLFRSVPERPESMWQRDGHNAVTDRLTGRSLIENGSIAVSLEGSELIATTIYHPKTKKIVHKRLNAN